ncbi:DUF418 domain-containing protein [Bacillus kwashiorkori]|uniref:DUF418 domain-containing protein n=1 Tax=Bacillus kwashiorkori TaxID=1522318 RepID=UPI000785FE08|nr:DUF418 domain-containing protein [Bacillus kwashiorkori]
MNGNIGIKENERIFSIDVMRGFAILGIFLFNIYSFHTPYLYIDLYSLAEKPLDRIAFIFVDVFVQASFYPLFAFLFGYGMIILKTRIELRNLNYAQIMMRRMFLLLIIGVIHAFFIWSGDILITYAVMGFIFILFANFSAKALSITGILLYLISNSLLSILLVIMAKFVPSDELQLYNSVEADKASDIYQHGSFFDVTTQRMADWSFANGVASFIMYLFMILPLFLLGASFAKSNRLSKSKANDKFFTILFGVTLPIGLWIKWIPYLFEKNYGFDQFQDLIGGPILTFAYISLIYFLANLPASKNLLRPLANVGKMSLSNYLFQSVVCSIIFFSYGFGLYGQVSYYQSNILAIVIFFLQIIISSLWLKYYRMGPLEWIWRGFTYKSFNEIKR